MIGKFLLEVAEHPWHGGGGPLQILQERDYPLLFGPLKGHPAGGPGQDTKFLRLQITGARSSL